LKIEPMVLSVEVCDPNHTHSLAIKLSIVRAIRLENACPD